MLAAETLSARTIALTELAEPRITAGHALVAVHVVTLCGTDLHIYEGDFPTRYPIVQGHEIAGTIVATDGGSVLPVGQRVVVDPLISCGECRACRGGRPNVCQRLSVIGCYEDGGLTEILSVPTKRLHPVPDSLPLDVAAMAEPASISLRAVSRAEPAPGEAALVLGCGSIGLLATLALNDRGVTVVAADTDPARAHLARTFGAAVALEVRAGFPDEAQRAMLAGLSDGSGPEIVIEATGVPASLENAVRLVAPAGRIVQVGISTREARITLKDLTDKEIDLRGSRNSVGLIPAGLALLLRHADAAAALLTHTFPLERLADAFDAMADREVATGKIGILMPTSQDGPAATA